MATLIEEYNGWQIVVTEKGEPYYCGGNFVSGPDDPVIKAYLPNFRAKIDAMTMGPQTNTPNPRNKPALVIARGLVFPPKFNDWGEISP